MVSNALRELQCPVCHQWVRTPGGRNRMDDHLDRSGNYCRGNGRMPAASRGPRPGN